MIFQALHVIVFPFSIRPILLTRPSILGIFLFSHEFKVFSSKAFKNYFSPLQDQLEQMYKTAPSIDTNTLANILSCATTLVTQDSASLGLPDFPLHNISKTVPIIEAVSVWLFIM